MLFRSFAELVPFLLVGSVFVAAVVLAVNYRAIRNATRSWKSVAGTWLLSCWLLGVCLVTLMPRAGGALQERTISLVPLVHTFGTGLGAGNSNLVESLANVAMFAVGGFIMKLVAGSALSKVVVRCLVLAICIEVLQFALDLGRVSSLDDVIWAGLGSAIGAATAGLLASKMAAAVASPAR
ncbi:VanZ family protein [Paeniglutamicibacter sp. MACA_103]|uniref:VanZ family protein n=1 Tax=Paeniglutamicibacter sp. MACA_103 TaxID=3377337 RepID=UPI0038931326